LSIEPSLSPISPEPVEPEIPSIEERITSFEHSTLHDQLAWQFFGGSSSAPPPPPPNFVSYSGYFYGRARSSAAPPPFYPHPHHGISTFGTT